MSQDMTWQYRQEGRDDEFKHMIWDQTGDCKSLIYFCLSWGDPGRLQNNFMGAKLMPQCYKQHI